MEPFHIKLLLIGILCFDFFFSKWLSWLNVRRDRGPVPTTLSGYVDIDNMRKADAYQRENFRFSLFAGSFSFLVTLLLVVFGFFGWLDAFLQQITEHPLGLPLLFFGLLFIGSDLLGIPLDYYHTFVIEEKFGFNKSSIKTFFTDKAKGYLLSILLGGPLLFALLSLIRYMGSDFWWQFWIISGMFMILANSLFSSIILPIFNKLSPLEDGELKAKILAYADSVGFSLDNVFIMDGSKRSSKANAFFSGFGKRKKVVLYDTLVEQHSVDELVAVLAHEVGHYKKRHVISNMLLGVMQVGIMLYVLSLLVYSENVSLALGGEGMAVHLNLIGFAILFSPLSTLVGVGMNALSRKHEFEADDFAKTTFAGQPLADALKTLSVNTLSNLNPHPWYVFVNYSHPPILKRLEKLEVS